VKSVQRLNDGATKGTVPYTPPDGEEAPQDRPPTSIPLKFKEKITLQEVYKALVKFALSVIETEK
jgi:hypothetical protein